MSGEKASDLRCICLLALDANTERFNSAQEQVRIERPQHCALAVLNQVKIVDELLIAYYESSSDHIAVPAQEFGSGVQHDVGAQFERVLQIGRQHGVIDAQQGSIRVGKLRQSGDVHDLK